MGGRVHGFVVLLAARAIPIVNGVYKHENGEQDESGDDFLFVGQHRKLRVLVLYTNM